MSCRTCKPPQQKGHSSSSSSCEKQKKCGSSKEKSSYYDDWDHHGGQDDHHSSCGCEKKPSCGCEKKCKPKKCKPICCPVTAPLPPPLSNPQYVNIAVTGTTPFTLDEVLDGLSPHVLQYKLYLAPCVKHEITRKHVRPDLQDVALFGDVFRQGPSLFGVYYGQIGQASSAGFTMPELREASQGPYEVTVASNMLIVCGAKGSPVDFSELVQGDRLTILRNKPPCPNAEGRKCCRRKTCHRCTAENEPNSTQTTYLVKCAKGNKIYIDCQLGCAKGDLDLGCDFERGDGFFIHPQVAISFADACEFTGDDLDGNGAQLIIGGNLMARGIGMSATPGNTIGSIRQTLDVGQSLMEGMTLMGQLTWNLPTIAAGGIVISKGYGGHIAFHTGITSNYSLSASGNSAVNTNNIITVGNAIAMQFINSSAIVLEAGDFHNSDIALSLSDAAQAVVPGTRFTRHGVAILANRQTSVLALGAARNGNFGLTIADSDIGFQTDFSSVHTVGGPSFINNGIDLRLDQVNYTPFSTYVPGTYGSNFSVFNLDLAPI